MGPFGVWRMQSPLMNGASVASEMSSRLSAGAESGGVWRGPGPEPASGSNGVGGDCGWVAGRHQQSPKFLLVGVE